MSKLVIHSRKKNRKLKLIKKRLTNVGIISLGTGISLAIGGTSLFKGGENLYYKAISSNLKDIAQKALSAELAGQYITMTGGILTLLGIAVLTTREIITDISQRKR